MKNRDGQLKYPPLIYVLASIRFAPWPLLGKKIDEIHNDLREWFPLVNNIRVRQIDPGGMAFQQEKESAAWMLKTSDLLYGVQFAPDQVLVMCKKYTRYKDFEAKLELVLETLYKHMGFIDVFNMGVRYVDHIKVKESGESLNDYVNKGLLPPDIEGMENIGGLVAGSYKSKDSDLRVRCISNVGAASVPEDLIPLLAILHGPGEPFKVDKLENGEMLLDLDSVQSSKNPQRMEQGEIIKLLNSLHKKANTFFRHPAVCTDHAFKVWKGDI